MRLGVSDRSVGRGDLKGRGMKMRCLAKDDGQGGAASKKDGGMTDAVVFSRWDRRQVLWRWRCHCVTVVARAARHKLGKYRYIAPLQS